MFHIRPKISFSWTFLQKNFANLETCVDVVTKLTAKLVHTRSHRWTLGLNIPEGGDCQDAGNGDVSSDIFLC